MIISWLKVVALGLGKIPLKILALVVVPFLSDKQRKYHSVWGVSDATDLSWKNVAVTNGIHNLTVRPQVEYRTKSNTTDNTLEKLKGFQWRYRESVSKGDYVSFRMTWGKPRNKGKKEFYIGWTMNETPEMRLTFFQFRPF